MKVVNEFEIILLNSYVYFILMKNVSNTNQVVIDRSWKNVLNELNAVIQQSNVYIFFASVL